jgi:hypothetical protein
VVALTSTLARAASGGLAEGPPLIAQLTSGRSHFLDALLVVVLFGGALFAVCRSSRRT